MTSDYAFPRAKEFIAFIKERHAIFKRRQHDPVGPWTDDSILAHYRFTNVYRELDRVTVWIARHWRDPHRTEPDVWFAMSVARFINHPPTLSVMGYQNPWNKERFLRALIGRKREGLKVFSSAYIVSTNGQARDKAEYLANDVFSPLWRARHEVRPQSHDTLLAFYNRLMQHQGMGSFMAAQIVADVKYTPIVRTASDWWTYAASGPRSRKGLNYVCGHDPMARWREHEWRDCLKELQHVVDPFIERYKMSPLHAQDLQNCLCEFSKYMRTRLGTGLPKQKFVPFIGSH